MIVLAAETCTSVASVALARDGKILNELVSDNPRTHTEFLSYSIEEILSYNHINLKDIDVLAISKGPGAFTGIRVALNAAKTFSYLFKKPIIVYDTLEILQKQSGRKDCVTMLNAYKNMVYWSVFKEGRRVDGPTAIFVKDIEKRLSELGIKEPLACLGDGFNAYQTVFSPGLKSLLLRVPGLKDNPLSSTLCKLVELNPKLNRTEDWNSIIPLYIRASEAEENLQLKV